MKQTLGNPSANSSFNTTEDLNNELVRLRAYELYEERGREDGHDVEDWLQAESEMTEEQPASSPIKSIAA